MKYKSNKQYQCPVCGGCNLNWGDTDLQDSAIAYNWVCEDCKAEGQEWYKLIFDGHEVLTKEDGYENVNDYILPED